MNNSLPGLAGVVILAGGNSRRMGTPKAKLTLPTTETLLDYHVRQASKLNVPIMIADNGRDFTVDAALLASNPELSIVHIADYHPSSMLDGTKTEELNASITDGPLVAIESALQTLADADSNTATEQASWLMVISCDSLITAHNLWQQLNPYIATNVEGITNNAVIDKSVICLTDNEHLYPLLGLYRLSIEPELRAYIDSGQRKVMSFIKPITQTVPVIEQWLPLTNFNTPEDFKRACESLYNL